MLYIHDVAWQALAPSAQGAVQSPAPGVSVLNIRPAEASHRELGPMKPAEADAVRTAARAVGLDVFDAPPPAGPARTDAEVPVPSNLPPQRVLIVDTAGDDWMGARKGGR